VNRQHGAAYAAFQAAQQTSADDTDRSGQDGAALQPNVSAALRPGKTERQRESSDAGGGTEVGGLSGGRGPWPDSLSRGGPRGLRRLEQKVFQREPARSRG